MKKLMLLAIFVMGCVHFTNAQNDTVLYIENFENGSMGSMVDICADKYQTVSIYAQNGCDQFWWSYTIDDVGYSSNDNPLIVPVIIGELYFDYHGCDGFFCLLYDKRQR